MPSPNAPLEQPRTPTRPTMGAGTLVLPIALFVIAGVPLVAVIWDTLNRVFAGQLDGGRIALAFVATLVFAGLLKLLARRVTGWQARRSE